MANETMFAVASYDKIQGYIDSGVLKYPAYVLCKDEAHKNNFVFIDKDLKMQPIKGYQQDTVIAVEKLPEADVALSNVFYFCNGIGYLYINSIPVPVFRDISEPISYDQLKDSPIVNKYGEPASPILLSDLPNGTYSVSGNYKIGGDLETVFSTANKHIILVDSDDTEKYITKFEANQILKYTVNIETGITSQDKYATESWIKSQGYATETYVTQAIDELYKKIADEALVTITKVSQLENDAGYLTKNDINGIGNDAIASLF